MIRNINWIRKRRLGIIVVLCFVLFFQSSSQQLRNQKHNIQQSKQYPMQSILFDLTESVRKNENLPNRIRELGLHSRADGKINVEILNQNGKSPLGEKYIRQFNGEVDATWRHRQSVWISPEQLLNVAKALPTGFFMKRSHAQLVDDEGPGKTNSTSYINGGADGTGIDVGIIDYDFSTIPAAQSNGDAPATYTGVDYTGSGLTSGSGQHGGACVEEVFDHAPEADYFIYRIANLTHFGNAVDHAVTNNVDIISSSLPFYNEGWDDNTGDACAAVATATDNGILFFTSAGNRAETHWQGNYTAGSGSSDWHDWSSGDETIDMTITSGGSGNFYLSWNTSGGTYDYDLYLYDASLTTVLASSTNAGNNYEEFSWTNNGASTVTVHLCVFRDNGGSTEFEVFVHDSGITWLEHMVAEGSTTSPSNSTRSNCISVGAVDEDDFDSTNGVSGILMSYSSQGPTNEGSTRPKLCGPTNTTTTAYGGAFGGTSAATPNAAGTAAAFWSSATHLSATGVRYLLMEKASIYKDWGTNGYDNLYGEGGIYLYDYHVNTRWVDRRYGNTAGSASYPYYYLSDAQTAATSGGRIVFLGQIYPEPIVLSKDIIYETIIDPAQIGE
ncbi:MAG: S8 family serine peptidase [Ignavibacteriae bacterium]|nr:S8 family serine peptidase [Ignavibacteriota bacterium]